MRSISIAGVVYTPPALARAMVAALGDAPAARWLDPCVGKGVFLAALGEHGVGPERITALDVRARPEGNDSLGQTRRGVDFLSWVQDKSGQFDRVIANPPYIPLSKLGRMRRTTALAATRLAGLPLSGRANYWSAFLVSATHALKLGGGMCFVVPAAWEYANYAESLRMLLPRYFAHIAVHRSARPLFASVAEGTIVIVATGRRLVSTAGPGEVVTFSHESGEELVSHLLGQSTEVRGSHVDRGPRLFGIAPRTARAGDLLRIRLGGVTGKVAFFLLTDTQRLEYGLPKHVLRPVLTRARHLVAAEVTASAWNCLAKSDERIWLLRPTVRSSRHPSVQRYLRKLPAAVRRKIFKLADRKPWYETPLPPKAHGFVSGMCTVQPWICLSGMEGLSATNTLYVIEFKRARTRDERAQVALSLLTTDVGEALKRIARRYPDGLLKFEPGDLSNLVLPVRDASKGAFAAYKMAVRFLLDGNPGRAHSIADEWFASSNSADEEAAASSNGAVARLRGDGSRALTIDTAAIQRSAPRRRA